MRYVIVILAAGTLFAGGFVTYVSTVELDRVSREARQRQRGRSQAGDE